MLVIEYEGIELDLCDACHGVWLDEGELELLLGDHEMTHGFLTAGNPAAAKKEESRPCPICDAVMGKAVTGGKTPVVYDYCPHEHGLWFDRGELLSILEQGSSDGAAAAVVQWLRHVFPDSSTPQTKQETLNP